MGEIEVKKSRFLCYLHRTESEDDARNFIRRIRKTYEFLVLDPIEPEIAELTSGTCTPMFLGEEVTEI